MPKKALAGGSGMATTEQIYQIETSDKSVAIFCRVPEKSQQRF